MDDDRVGTSDLDRLPEESVDRLTRPFKRFLRIEATGGAFLLAFTIAALVLSNSPWSSLFMTVWDIPIGLHIGTWESTRSLKGWINDGLMTFFFFLVAVELKRGLVLGELKSPRVAALSIAAALGGMIIPAGLYLALQSGLPGEAGWGTVMATDTAFVIGCLALLGRRIPQSLRTFMLALAIVDDIGAVLVVAFGYSGAIDWNALIVAGAGIAAVRVLAWGGVRNVAIYLLVGSFIWAAVDASGIHATVTGVILGLLTPARRWVSDLRLYAILNQVIAHSSAMEGSGDTKDRKTLHTAEVAARETLSPAERLQMIFHPWVSFVVMPLFALANAGLPLFAGEGDLSLTMAIIIGFTLGKPIGVLSFSWIAVRLGIAAIPPGLGWALLAAGSLLAGIGFTMALFIANLAFDRALLDQAKVGILAASVLSAAGGLACLTWVTRAKQVS